MKNAVVVTIPDDILKRLEKVKDAKIGCGGHKWKPWEDEVLRKFWQKKDKRELAKLIGVHVNTARNRYKELMGGENEKDIR